MHGPRPPRRTPPPPSCRPPCVLGASFLLGGSGRWKAGHVTGTCDYSVFKKKKKNYKPKKTKQGARGCSLPRTCVGARLGTWCLWGCLAQVQGQGSNCFEGGVLQRRDRCQHSGDRLEWRDGWKTSYYWPSAFLASVFTESKFVSTAASLKHV